MSDFAVGTTIAITVNTNSTGDVVSASGAIKLSSGTTTFLASEAITTYSPAVGSQEGTGNAQAPVIGFEAQLIGDGGADTATFTQASGTITYSSSTALVASPTPVGISYVQYNGANKGTVEKSNIAYGVVTSQTTTSTGCTGSSTIICTSYPPAFGMDVGPALWGFNAKGFWFMSGTSNTTLSLVTWVGLVGPTAVPNHKCGSALVWSFSHNSTTYIYTGVPPSAVACSGSSLTPLVHLYISNVTGAYNQKEISGSVSTVRTGVAQFVMNQILFSLTSTAQASVCDSKSHVVNGQTVPPCNSQQFSQTAFSWGAITTPSYNNATHVLTANSTVSLVSGASFPFDPLAIDGSAYCVESSGGTCTTTTLTTSHSPDVIIVMEHSTGNYCTAPTGTGLSFSLRVNNHAGDGDCVAEYYAIASSTYSHTLVCNWSGSYAEGCTAFGISGANTASPFDANSAIPCSSNGNSGSSNIPSCTISTSNAADFIITMVSEGNSHTFTPPSGYTNIGGCSGSRYCDAYGVVSSTYSGFALSWSSLGDTFWVNVVDAIQQASSGVTTTLTFSPSVSLSAGFAQSVAAAFNVPSQPTISTVTTETAGNAQTGFNAQVTVLYGAGLYWSFYVPISEVITYSTSSDALSWSAGTALAGWPGNSPQDWSIYSSGTTVYMVDTTTAGNFDWRYGTLTSGGTITWTIGITSVASLYTTRANPYITVDGSGNVWVADTEYAAGPVYYLEVYENVGGSWSNVYSHLNDFGIQSVIPLANGGVSLIWQDASTGAISILGWSGSAWSSPSSPSSIYSTQWSATAISNTIYFVGEDAVVGNVRFWSSVYPFSSVSAETILNSGTTNEWASVTTDGSSKLVAVYAPSSTTMDYRVSLNSGASWGPERSITTTEASITNGDGNTFPRMNGNIGYGEFTEGTGSPWSIRFFTIDTTSPSILLSAAFEQQVQPNPFAVGIVLTPFFSTGVVPVITFTATIGLSATFDQGVTPNLGGLGITLTPIFVAVPCIGCGGGTSTTTITTTSTVTSGNGTTTVTTTPGQIIGGNENDPLVPFLVVLCFIVILVAAVLVRRRNVVNSRYLESG
jgi:hypothetical protein